MKRQHRILRDSNTPAHHPIPRTRALPFDLDRLQRALRDDINKDSRAIIDVVRQFAAGGGSSEERTADELE